MKNGLLKVIEAKKDQDIVIIGKGPSIDKVRTDLLDDSIVINVNDSEIICPGEIAIFHSGWVLDRFDHHRPKAKLHIVTGKQQRILRTSAHIVNVKANR